MLETPAAPPPAAPGRRPSGGLDLQMVLDLFARRWPLIAAIAVVVTAAVVGGSLLLTPQYEAQARLRISPMLPKAVQTDQASAVAPDQAVVDTEVSIMRSRDIAEAVARRLDLAADPAFAPPADSPADRAEAARGQVPTGVLRTLLGNVTAVREPETYIVAIAYKSPNPVLAARIANTFAEEYLRSSVERRTGTAARQSKWLDDRLSAMGSEVQQADAAVAQYRARAGITTGGAGAAAAPGGTITDQQIAPLSNQLATAEAEAAAARSNVAAARAQIANGGLDAVSSVLNSNVIADLRRQRAELQRQQAEILTRYGPKHPESIRVTEQLAGLDKALRDEANRIVGSLQAQASAAEASAASLRGNLARLRVEQAGDTRAGVMADSLERQADAKRTVYNKLAEAAQQTGQEEHSLEAQGAVVERAVPPTKPFWPNKKLFVFVGAILGVLLGVAVSLLLELLSTGLRTVDDVERGLGVPFIASLPRLTKQQLREAGGRGEPADYVAAKPMSSYAEALRTVRNSLLLARGTRPRVLSVLSAVPGEGKTSTACALGRIMALSGDRVVLVDGDLRRGGVGRLLAGPRGAGLVEVLEGQARLDEALVRDEASGLDVLPLVATSFTPKDLFSGDAMRALLGELVQRYDLVLIDTPPMLAVSDARTLAGLSDATLMVVRWQYTPKRAVSAALALLEQDGTPVTGAVLSMADPRARAVGAADPAYYHKMYRQYFQA